MQRNAKTRTAVELLPILEEEYAVKKESDINIRRAMIIAKKRMQDCPITKPDLIKIMEAIGVTIDIEHYYNEYAINIIIIENNFNLSFTTIIDIIDDNIRAHINIYLRKRSIVQTELYIAHYYENLISYNLKTEFPRVNVTCAKYAINTTEMCQTYNLQLQSSLP